MSGDRETRRRLRLPTRARRGVNTATAKASVAAESAQRAVDWIERHRFLGVIVLTAHRFGAQHLPTHAAAISFQAVVSLIPLVTFLLASASFFLDPDVLVEQVLDLTTFLAPGANSVLNDAITSVTDLRAQAGLISLLGLLWTGSNLFGALRRGLNAATATTRQRTFVHSRAVDLSIALSAGALLALSVTITALLQAMQQAEPFGQDSPFVWLTWALRGVGVLIPIVFVAAIAGTFFHVVPAQRLGWRPALAGGLLTAAGFELGKNAFVWYSANIASFNLVYGPISTVVVLLIWLYYSALIFLGGAAFGSAIAAAGRHARRHTAADAAPDSPAS